MTEPPGPSIKKRKKYHSNNPHKRGKYNLEPGLKGFLCSCNFREKDCVRESYNILNEYFDRLHGSENDPTDLEEEIKALKAERRFQVVESGAKNFLFIRTTLDDPVRLAETIIKDVAEQKAQKTRYLLRLVPIEATCKAYLEDIKTTAAALIEKHFKDSPKTFSVIFNHRNNNSVPKDDVIKALADLVAAQRSDHKVDLKNAETSIVVEVVRGIALLGVVPNFLKYKKYNLQTLAEDEPKVEIASGDNPSV